VPGLAGSLVIAVGSLALWNLPGLRAMYDTPAPLVLALVLQLLPWAVLLDRAVARGAAGPAAHAARLMAAGGDRHARREGAGLLWRLAWGPRFAAWAVLFCIACADLASTALLHPSGTAPAPVLLYNLMHYGRTGTLSAMVLIAAVAPALVIVLGIALVRVCAAGWMGSLGRARWS
jgi:ABC-type Fe3+ transport system permease subunit